MELQLRKRYLSDYIMTISDEAFVEKLETFFKINQLEQTNQAMHPMSLDQFYDMMEQAKQDKDNGRLIAHDDLKKKIKSW